MPSQCNRDIVGSHVSEARALLGEWTVCVIVDQGKPDPIGSKLFVLAKENELITLKNTYSNFEPIQFTAFPLDDLKQKRKETKPKVWRGSLFPPRLDHMMIFYVIVG